MGHVDGQMETFEQLTRDGRTERRVEDIYDLLTRDHRSMRRLFDQIEAIPEEAPLVRQQVYFVLRKAILDHAEAEEEVVYERLALAEDEELRDMIVEAREEHALIEFVIEEIDDIDPDDDVWSAKIKVLRDLVERHIDDEEALQLPAMRRELAEDENEELAAIFVACKDELAEYDD
jgi:hypothetical protein